MAIISIPTSVSGVNIPGPLGQFAQGPLASLFGGSGLSTYKYPSDLASSAQKNHYVQFSIKKIKPAGYNVTNGSIDANSGQNIGLPNAAAGAKSISSLIQGQQSQLEQAKNSGNFLTAGIANVSEGLGNFAIGVLDVTSSLLSKGLTISPQLTESVAAISLYMPDTLTADYNADYQNLNITDLGTGINTLRMIDQVAPQYASSLGSIIGSVMSGDISSAGTKLKNVLNTASSDPAVIALATSAVGGALGSGSALQDFALKGQGYAINPQLQLIYRGTDFREFQLTFLFTPKSQDEADNVNNIIKTFREQAAPTITSGLQTSGQGMFFIPPSIFQVQFNIGASENQYLPKYGDCVLENISVNYTPNGYASYASGAPVQTQLTLDFKEIVIVDYNSLQSGKLR